MPACLRALTRRCLCEVATGSEIPGIQGMQPIYCSWEAAPQSVTLVSCPYWCFSQESHLTQISSGWTCALENNLNVSNSSIFCCCKVSDTAGAWFLIAPLLAWRTSRNWIWKLLWGPLVAGAKGCPIPGEGTGIEVNLRYLHNRGFSLQLLL